MSPRAAPWEGSAIGFCLIAMAYGPSFLAVFIRGSVALWGRRLTPRLRGRLRCVILKLYQKFHRRSERRFAPCRAHLAPDAPGMAPAKSSRCLGRFRKAETASRA